MSMHTENSKCHTCDCAQRSPAGRLVSQGPTSHGGKGPPTLVCYLKYQRGGGMEGLASQCQRSYVLFDLDSELQAVMSLVSGLMRKGHQSSDTFPLHGPLTKQVTRTFCEVLS